MGEKGSKHQPRLSSASIGFALIASLGYISPRTCVYMCTYIFDRAHVSAVTDK